MFFGRKPEPEKVDAANLIPLLNRMFDKKLGNLEHRASGITKELESMKAEFSRVCGEFEKLDAPPYTEDLWNPNINSIKSQKAAYASALRNVISKLSLEAGDAQNAYSRYKSILLNVEEATGSILHYNSNFKLILYCYSNHLRGFKKTFSDIERLRDALKSELDSRAGYFNIYNSIAEQISRLDIFTEEAEAAERGIAAIESSLNSTDDGEIEKSEKDAEQKVQQKMSELSSVNKKLSELQNRVNLLVTPLDRASKKFDHLSPRKKRLSNFIADPMAAIQNEPEYNEFVDLLNELKSSVESGKVEVKNKPEIISAISRLVESNIYVSMQSLEPVRMQKYDLEKEVRELERIRDAIKAAKEGKAKSLQKIESLKADVKRIASSKEQLKASIEKSFSDNYSKQISIAMQ